MENSNQVPQKVKIEIPYDPESLFFRYLSKENKNTTEKTSLFSLQHNQDMETFQLSIKK